MKRIQDRQDIKLLNYSSSKVCVSTGKNEFVFEGARDGVPSFRYVNWNELEEINNHYTVIESGMLVLSEEDREEGYAALKLPNWKDTILFDEDIDDMIARPTLKKLERILGVRDIHTIERFRGKVGYRKNCGLGVDSRFADVVEGRYKEICRGVARSKISLNPRVDYAGAKQEDVQKLKEKNSAMEQELVLIKAQMAELVKANKKESKRVATSKPVEDKTVDSGVASEKQ